MLGVAEKDFLAQEEVFFFQDENLWGFPLDLKTSVSLGSWRLTAKEALRPAHEDAPGGSGWSPRPVSLGTLPSNQRLGQGGEGRTVQLLPGRPR